MPKSKNLNANKQPTLQKKQNEQSYLYFFLANIT